jgi:hypothetical protein
MNLLTSQEPAVAAANKAVAMEESSVAVKPMEDYEFFEKKLADIKLPKALELMVSKEPEGFKSPLVIGLLPVFGTLASGVRFRYNSDTEVHSLTFYSCIEAPSASGKSFIKRHKDLLMTPIIEIDDEERAKAQAYQDAVKKAKNKREQPDNPKPCIRDIGAVSRSMLLQLMQNANGKHVFAFYPEIATMVNQKKRGAWANIDDLFCLAFDNDFFKQDFKSGESFSGKVQLLFNLLMTGTPDARAQFFSNVACGSVQRTAFAALPDMFGKPLPTKQAYTKEEEQLIIQVARDLMQEQGDIEYPELETAILTWAEKIGQKAVKRGSRALDEFRKRAAVTAYRAGMLCYLLNGKHKTNDVIYFAYWIAQYVLHYQMKLFGRQLEAIRQAEISSSYGTVANKSRKHKHLDELSQTFSREDLKQVLFESKTVSSDCLDSRAASYLNRWRKDNLIKKVEGGGYEKIA